MENFERARKMAASIVSFRMYTCREVFDKLLKKGIDKETAEKVVLNFAEAKILDDFEYAKAYASDSVNLSAKGLYRIKQELYKKGVARSIIDKATEGLEDEALASLYEYVKSRNLCDGISTRYELEKLKARLARRGYLPSDIKKVLSEYTFEFKEED